MNLESRYFKCYVPVYETRSAFETRSPNLTLDCQFEIAGFQRLTGAYGIVGSLETFEYEPKTCYRCSFSNLKMISCGAVVYRQNQQQNAVCTAPTPRGTKLYPRDQHCTVFVIIISTPDGGQIPAPTTCGKLRETGNKVAKANAVVD